MKATFQLLHRKCKGRTKIALQSEGPKIQFIDGGLSPFPPGNHAITRSFPRELDDAVQRLETPLAFRAKWISRRSTLPVAAWAIHISMVVSCPGCSNEAEFVGRDGAP
jgi:hypothetical protein